jgi:hypothetical protein
MIHMIRDPRDRYAGSLARSPDGKARAGGAVARWFYTTHLANRNLKKYPDSYMTVGFEDMVINTEDVIRSVCDFLGEEFYNEMLTMSGAPEHREKLIQRSHRDPKKPPLSPKHIGIYQIQVPEQEIVFIQNVAHRSLIRYGYSRDRIHFSIKAWTSYLFSTWPLNMVRMFLWMAVEIVQHNLPGVFGRKPGSNMIVDASSKNSETVTA